MNRAVRWIEGLNEFFAVVMGWLVVVMMLLTTVSVVLRYFFRAPIFWSVEICQYLLLWSFFLGVGYTTAVGGHVRVDMLLNRLSAKNRKFLDIVTLSMSIVFGAVITWQTWRLLMRAYSFDWHSETLLAVYLVPIYAIMPVGCGLLTLQLFINLYKLSKAGKG
jgi:TRAP-type C4-dicarboxylate transport system permease small subunit